MSRLFFTREPTPYILPYSICVLFPLFRPVHYRI
nr:MAG TPA: hypothetical protein [Caudoviricetes sp.]